MVDGITAGTEQDENHVWTQSMFFNVDHSKHFSHNQHLCIKGTSEAGVSVNTVVHINLLMH